MDKTEKLVELASRGPLQFITVIILCILTGVMIYFIYRTFRDLEAYFLERKYADWELNNGDTPREEETDV